MKPVYDHQGTILNAMVLTAEQVTQQPVRCPVCSQKDFQTWPGGWDAHAAHKCACLDAATPETRKLQFKTATRHLFV
jgi:hypothetical protein